MNTPPSPQGRIYVEEVNAVFLREGGSPDEYRAGIEQLKAEGLIDMHDSGTYFTLHRQGCATVRVMLSARSMTTFAGNSPNSGNFLLALLHRSFKKRACARANQRC
jgi:hypothetical protein